MAYEFTIENQPLNLRITVLTAFLVSLDDRSIIHLLLKR